MTFIKSRKFSFFSWQELFLVSRVEGSDSGNEFVDLCGKLRLERIFRLNSDCDSQGEDWGHIHGGRSQITSPKKRFF